MNNLEKNPIFELAVGSVLILVIIFVFIGMPLIFNTSMNHFYTPHMRVGLSNFTQDPNNTY